MLIGLKNGLVKTSNHTKCASLSHQNYDIYILMNTFKNYGTIHLRLI